MRSIRRMVAGAVLAQRREYSELDRILGHDERTVADGAQIRRLCLELNTLAKVLTRTRRAEIDEQRAVREPRDIEVSLLANERELYDAVLRWQTERAKAHGMPLHFIGQMPLRLAGSCLPAIRDQILRARDSGIRGEGLVEDLFDGPAADADPWDRPPDETVSAALALGDVDTKFTSFAERLMEIVGQGHRVLVFTFSRPVVAYLHRRLRDRLRVEVLHGGVLPQDRRRRIAAFREGRCDVMLATRVASEGLDFEFCSVGGELRPALESDGGRAAHWANRPLRSAVREGLHPELRHSRHHRDRYHHTGSPTHSGLHAVHRRTRAHSAGEFLRHPTDRLRLLTYC